MLCRNEYAGAAPFGGQYPQFPTGANPYSSMSGQAPRPYPGMNGAYPQYPQQNESGYPERIQENGIGKTTPGTVKNNRPPWLDGGATADTPTIRGGKARAAGEGGEKSKTHCRHFGTWMFG